MTTPKDTRKKDTGDLDKKIAAREAKLTAIFNDPANSKFDKIWMREADIADDLLQACNWYKNWSEKRDGYIAANDAERASSCEGMVEWWDERLVKTIGRLARFDEKLGQATDDLSKEFNSQRDTMSLLTEVRDVLAALDDKQIKNGKAIFDAVMPLLTPKPATTPAPKANPLDKGNPFKK